MRLNEEQRRAVETHATRTLVLASAGTGKTTTMAARVAHFIERGYAPRHVGFVTYTRAAAAELRDRVVAISGPQGRRVSTGTLHGLGREVLRRAAGAVQPPGARSALCEGEPRVRFFAQAVRHSAAAERGYRRALEAWTLSEDELPAPEDCAERLSAAVLHAAGIASPALALDEERFDEAFRGEGPALAQVLAERLEHRAPPDAVEHYRRTLRQADPRRFHLRRLAAGIGRFVAALKQSGEDPDRAWARLDETLETRLWRRLAEAPARRYAEALAQANERDYEDDIAEALAAIDAGAVAPLYEHLIVDEYQDVNPAQARLVEAVARLGTPNGRDRATLTVVGDDWQSIMGFQGGDVNRILRFGNDPRTRTVVLRRTYRLTAPLARASTAWARDRSEASAKTVHSERPGPRDWPAGLVVVGDRTPGPDGPVAVGRTGALARVLHHLAPDAPAEVMVLSRHRRFVRDVKVDVERLADEVERSWATHPETGPRDVDPRDRPKWRARALRTARAQAGDGLLHGYLKKTAQQCGLRLVLGTDGPDTIHSAKGLESDYVVLLDHRDTDPPVGACEASLQRLDPARQAQAAEEHRLWYVAMSRARRKCYVVVGENGYAERSALAQRLIEHVCEGTIEAELYELAHLLTPPGRGVPCPQCEDGWLVRREGRRGPFAGCDRFRDGCRSTAQVCLRCQGGILDPHTGRCDSLGCRPVTTPGRPPAPAAYGGGSRIALH